MRLNQDESIKFHSAGLYIGLLAWIEELLVPNPAMQKIRRRILHMHIFIFYLRHSCWNFEIKHLHNGTHHFWVNLHWGLCPRALRSKAPLEQKLAVGVKIGSTLKNALKLARIGIFFIKTNTFQMRKWWHISDTSIFFSYLGLGW